MGSSERIEILKLTATDSQYGDENNSEGELDGRTGGTLVLKLYGCCLGGEGELKRILQGLNVSANSFIGTNLIHNFLYKLHKIKFFYMFRGSSAHLQEVNDVNCTCMQPLVFSFSAGSRLVHLLRGVSRRAS